MAIQLPIAIGDTVRDKKSNTDYVIESITGLTAGGAITVFAIRVTDRKIEEWHYRSPNAILDGKIKLFRYNNLYMLPSDVVSHLNNSLKKNLGDSEELFRMVHEPENHMFKDLLLITGETGPLGMENGIIGMAEAIVNTVKAVPSKTALKQMLTNSVKGAEFEPSEEFIDHFVEKVIDYTRTRIPTQKSLTFAETKELAPFMFNNKGMFGGDLSILANHGLTNQDRNVAKKIDDKLTRKIIKDLFSGDQVVERNFLGSPLEHLAGSTAKTRYDFLARRFVETQGGLFSKETKSIFDSAWKASQKAAQSGHSTAATQALANFISQHPDFEPLNRTYKNVIEASRGIAFRHKQFNKARLYERMSTSNFARPDVNFGKLIKGLTNKDNFVTVDKSTFFDKLVRNSKVTMGGKALHLTPELKAEISKRIPHKFVALTPSKIRDMLKSHHTGEPINLDSILEGHSSITSRLEKTSISEIESKHLEFDGTKHTASGQKALVYDYGKPKINSGEKLYIFDKADAGLGTTTTYATSNIGLAREHGKDNFREKLVPFIPEEYKDKISGYTRGFHLPKHTAPMTVAVEHKINVSVNKRTESFEEAFSKAEKETRIALAGFRREGKQETALIDTAIERPIEDQLKSARNFYLHGGGILDIETRDVGLGGIKNLNEVALSTNGKDFLLGGKSISNDVERVREIIKLADHLETIENIGTQGNYDFKHLINIAKVLAEKYESDRPALEKAIAILEHTANNKLFDLQLIHGLTGETAGFRNQPHLTTKYLKDKFGNTRFEQHEARQDVTDAFELAEIKRNQFLGMEGLHLQRNEAEHSFYLNTDTISPNYGKILKPIDFYSHTGENGESKSIATVREYTMKSGNLIPGIEYPIIADSPTQLTAALTKNARKFEAHQAAEIFPEYKGIIEDSSSRNIRSLNPMTKTIYDQLDMFDPNEMGDFGVHNLKMEVEAESLLPKARELAAKYESEGLSKVKANYKAIDTILAKKYNKLQGRVKGVQLAFEKTDNYRGPAVERLEKKLANLEIDQEYMRMALDKMLAGGRESQLMLDRETSSWARLKDSPVAKALISAHNREESSPGFYFLQYADLLGEAAKAGNVFKNTESVPRFSVKIGGQPVSNNMLHISDVEKTGNKLRLGATEALFGLLTEKTHFGAPTKVETEEFLKSAGINNIEHITQLMLQYQEEAGVQANLPQFKTVLEKLAHQEKGGKYGDLLKARDTILAHESTKNAVLTALNKKIENLHAELNEEEKLKAQKIGQKLIEGINNLQPKHGLPDEISKLFTKAMETDSKGFNTLFKDRYRGVDTDALIDFLDPEKLKNSTKSLNTLYDNVAREDFGSVEIARHVQDVFETYHKNLIEGNHEQAILTIKDGLDAIRDLHAQGMKTQAIKSAQRAATPSNMKIMATEVNKARQAAQKSGEMELTHMIVHSATTYGSQYLTKLSVPLMAVGGALALMSGHETRDDGFSQGNMSNQVMGLGPANKFARIAEIPGEGSHAQVWHGDQDPFRLDISFSGYVQSKRHQEELTQQVFDVINSQVEVRKTSGEIQDARRRDHSMPARDLLRRSV
jgi:hypothetical protein